MLVVSTVSECGKPSIKMGQLSRPVTFADCIFNALVLILDSIFLVLRAVRPPMLCMWVISEPAF